MAEPTQSKSEKMSFWKQLKSFGPVYWIANWMELIERFAYYGVRVVLPVFMVEAFENGGPEFTHIQKGSIYGVWAIVQSFVPIFSGGFADRYGYKGAIAISTVLKIIGYLLMGYAIPIAESWAGMPLAEARPLGADSTYELFFLGAMFLAAGTAIFKPGVQGLIANQIPKGDAAALGWGVFYQAVNIGGFVGPLLAGYLRVLDWEYVFLACAAGISLNFIPLFFFKEPAHHGDEDTDGPAQVLWRAVTGLLEARLFFFTICFAGFWLMFYQLFDILPNFINDWVDSRSAAAFLGSIFGEGAVPTVNGGNLTQEWMINFNALLISLMAFAFGYMTGKVRSLTAIVAGIAVSAVAIYGLGMSMNGWWILAAIGLFSIGEMMASPTKMRYLAGIAPPGKEGLYMGYANMTVGIGWSIGSIVAGEMYETGGDKINLARRYLVEHAGQAAEAVEAISKKELLPFFEKTVGVDAWGTRDLLWETYDPSSMWLLFTLIGVGSMLALVVYSRLVEAADKDPNHSFNVKALVYVRYALAPISAMLIGSAIYKPSLPLIFMAGLFTMLAAVAWTQPVEKFATIIADPNAGISGTEGEGKDA